MHASRKPGLLRRLVTTVTITATALLGTPAVAHAGTVTGPAGGGAKPAFTAACGAAKQGRFTCFALRRDDITATKGVRPLADLPSGYGPADLRGAYALPDNGGAGTTVAIVDAYDDPTAEADLAVYRQQYGLPPCTTANGCFTKSDQRGGTAYPSADPGWAGEISLDLDMVSAVAPNAHLLLVESDSSSFADMTAAVDQAVAAGAKYVSNSYGSNYDSAPGSGEDPTELTDLDVHYNHPGVAMVASSGDGDYGVSYPAASQYVTSVGGTALVRDSSARGWSESVWHNQYGGPGSGCSAYEPKPSFQKDTGCDKRSVADVSAVSDPATGVAVYQTFGGGGWAVYGGTSAASPIIAGVYALAGTPVAGTYPNAYPYAATGALNDVTSGANGSCTPSYLCTAGAGYDGPTGLGTPKGVAAFTSGPHGEVSGTVTGDTGAPLAGVAVTAGPASATTAADGTYDLRVPVGTYDVTAAAYGYHSKTVTGVAVAEGATVTENFSLTAVPSTTVNGTVVDDSGHGWPLYAKVQADGVPGGPVFTDPTTGRFSLDLPQGADYTLHVTPVYSGYEAVTKTVTVADKTVNVTFPATVDVLSCTAPGYLKNYHGGRQTFDDSSAPSGWTVTDADGTSGGWTFTDDGKRGNKTGGTGGFAIVDSDHQGSGKHQDSTLTGPVVDLSAEAHPILGFDTDFYALSSPVAAELSIDGGTTWSAVWQHTDSLRGPAHVEIPLPQAAGQASARVRFHYTGSYSWWWQLDNVLLGSATCDPVKGGLLEGRITDGNTGDGVVGAAVTIPDAPSAQAVSAATPDDANLGDGFYWMFAPVTGAHTVNVTKTGYTGASKSTKIAVDFTTAADFTLGAGRVTVKESGIDKTLAWQGTATATLTLKNTGSAPATVKLAERSGSSKPLLTGSGAPLNKVAGKFSNKSSAAAKASVKAQGVTPKDVTPSGAAWQPFANYPTTIQDNTVAVGDDGKLYSVFGYDGEGDSTALYSYDSGTGAWTALAPAGDAREAAPGAFIGGKLITTGGWGPGGGPDAKTEIYDPATGKWTTGAANPGPAAAPGKAVLDGKLYLIGGCSANSCGSTSVRVYDPAANTWTTAANYPLSISWVSCGALAGQILCAGGQNDNATYKSTYAYDPGSNTWSPRANMPIDLWASASSAANGQLLVSGGVTDGNATLTNQGFTYDPAADAWTALPNANQTRYRAGSACGLYRIGGNPGGLFAPPVADSEVLPGFTECGSSTDVSWLSLSTNAVTVAAGKSAKVTVTLDASVSDITQPGLYTAAIGLSSDTPYAIPAVPIGMTVNPPKTWGKIAGRVTAAADGTAVGGVTVQIDTWATSYTLKTAADGTYQLWLDTRNNPLQLIAAKDGYQPQTRSVKISKGATTTADFALKKS